MWSTVENETDFSSTREGKRAGIKPAGCRCSNTVLIRVILSSQFMFYLLALLIVGVFTFGGSYLLYKVTNLILPMRVTAEQEEIGLDITQHGEEAFDLSTK